ncbi:hypothetical protein Sste5346_005372 [Sporothrix stenoceras]|uniref:Uncharacterized protein n=1 Tax=Sporothrix stenoceras TaxID=5173 RepID=A0ABR3Z4S1_9PEZI
MSAFKQNQQPVLYSREWSHPKAGTDLWIPPPHHDSPALVRNGGRQLDGVRRSKSPAAKAALNRLMMEAHAAIGERYTLEKYFENDFQGQAKDITTDYAKVVNAFLHLPFKMRYGVAGLHVHLCRLVVARCCCEGRFKKAKELANAARLAHSPPNFEQIVDVPWMDSCPEFDRLEKQLRLPNGHPDMSDKADMARLRVKLEYFYKLMGLKMPSLEPQKNSKEEKPKAPIAVPRPSVKVTKETKARVQHVAKTNVTPTLKPSPKPMLKSKPAPLPKPVETPKPVEQPKVKPAKPSIDSEAKAVVKELQALQTGAGATPAHKISLKRLFDDDNDVEINKSSKKLKKNGEEDKGDKKEEKNDDKKNEADGAKLGASDSEDDDDWIRIVNRPRVPTNSQSTSTSRASSRGFEAHGERITRERIKRKEQREQQNILHQFSKKNSKDHC